MSAGQRAFDHVACSPQRGGQDLRTNAVILINCNNLPDQIESVMPDVVKPAYKRAPK